MSRKGDSEFKFECPYCGVEDFYHSELIDINGNIRCQHCDRKFHTESGVLISDDSWLMPLDKGVRVICPVCQAVYVYFELHMQDNHQVRCQNCSKLIDAVGEEVFVYDSIPKDVKFDRRSVCIVMILLYFFSHFTYPFYLYSYNLLLFRMIIISFTLLIIFTWYQILKGNSQRMFVKQEENSK